MSRVARNPISLPKGVDVTVDGQDVNVKGPKGALEFQVHDMVDVDLSDSMLRFKPRGDSRNAVALAGTTRSIVNGMVHGVSEGFERRLVLVGVGFRAQAQNNVLHLTVGLSHPVEYKAPATVTVETPSQTEVVVRGINKQQVGQVAAEIRGFRPPDPYKGKGIRYGNEVVTLKEAKKK